MTWPRIERGEVLPVELELTSQEARPLKLSMRLVAADGSVIAQNDAPAEPAVRLGLLIPPDVAAGEYALSAVLYDPATAADILTRDGDPLGRLATITVTE